MRNEQQNPPRPILDDDKIIELYWNRNEKAIQATDDKYHRYLITIANNIVRNEQDSEECINDTYLGTWNQIPPKRPNIFGIFLAKLTRNIAVSRYRQNSAAKRIPSEIVTTLDEIDEVIPDIEEGYDDREINALAEILNSFLRTLDEREEFIFVSRYYYSYPVPMIANMLHVSTATVYNELAAIKGELKKTLVKEGYRYE